MLRAPRRAITATAAIALISACSFSPINHHIKVGEEAFVVFVGEGVDHNTDLFAVSADGGSVAQITFTPLIERGPRLSATGELVAFVRMRDMLPDAHRDVVVMNLLSGGEVTLALPTEAGIPQAVAWSADARTLYIRTDSGNWQATTPPAAPLITPVPPAEVAIVDSALDTWLGDPRFARVIPCTGGGLCIIGPRRDTMPLAPQGHDPIRWGTDSVAWFQQDGIMVRSLGPGRERRVSWTRGPDHPREGSYAAAGTK